MQFTSYGRRATRVVAGLTIAASAVLGACSGGASNPTEPEGPIIPGTPPSAPQLQQSAFVFDVDMRSGRVSVTAPQNRVTRSFAGGAQSGPDYSILSNDVIEISTSGFTAGRAGEGTTPNRRRVYFDVQILNRIAGINLVTPTFPEAPPGQSGVILFPFSTNVTVTQGGTSTENGNVVVVDLPSTGEVNPNIFWNGSATPDLVGVTGAPGAGGEPFNFFNDASCTAVGSTPTAGQAGSDCYRYETFGPIAGGAISSARRVGFDIDAEVNQFRARLIVAADIQAATGAATGTISGTVTSPQRALPAVTVTATGVAPVTTTAGTGAYTIASVGLGARTVSVSGLPAGCTTPPSQSVTVTSGATLTANFVVTCTAEVGTVNGSITRAGTGTQSLAGVTATIDPTAAGAPSVTVPVTALAYSGSVQVGLGAGAGEGSVSLNNLPADCTAGGAAAYTGLTSGGTVVAPAITVTCTAPLPRYELEFVWGTPTATSVTLDIFFDPTGEPGLAARNIATFQARVRELGAAAGRLTYASATAGAGGFTSPPTVNNLIADEVTIVQTALTGTATRVRVATLTYTIAAGAGTTVTLDVPTAGLVLADEDGGPIPLGDVRVITSPLTLP